MTNPLTAMLAIHIHNYVGINSSTCLHKKLDCGSKIYDNNQRQFSMTCPKIGHLPHYDT